MNENIFTTVSNITCLIPLYYSIKRKDYISAIAIFFVSMASTISHWVENHKHNMKGNGYSKKVSELWNKLDKLGVFLVSVRFLTLIKSSDHMYQILFKNKTAFVYLISSFSCGFISEADHHSPGWKKCYIVTHSIWHLTIYPLMAYYYNKVFE